MNAPAMPTAPVALSSTTTHAIPPLLQPGEGVAVPTSFMLTLVLALIALVLVTLMIIRAKKPLQLPPLQSRPGMLAALRNRIQSGPKNPWWAIFGQSLHALRYLTTRREWRYGTPWVMLLGEKSAGKSSIAASISSGHRQTLLLREKHLAIDGSDWHFYDGGVLIDPLGDLPTAAADSTDGKVWSAFLSALELHRPERPLDAIVLNISARTLLNADYATRQACAEQSYEQLFTLQKRFEFAYPIYVVVNQCDSIPGFGAFWQPHELDKSPRGKEMWGWSSPSLQDSGSAPENVASAWRKMRDGMLQLQIEAAASDRKLDDGDRFFLFPQEFQRLQEPLAAFLEVVFQPSVYHANFYLRGIYCCGSIDANGARKDGSRNDIAFVDQLFGRKIFAETNLARPTRESIWSRNRWLRRLQIGGIGFFALLAITLATATTQLDNKIEALASAIQMVRHQPAHAEECRDKSSVFSLLNEINKADTDLHYLLIPASWVDGRIMSSTAREISDGAFQKVVMPSLRCHLDKKIQTLLSTTSNPPPVDQAPGEAVSQAKQQLQQFLSDLVALEHQLRAFDSLARQASSENKKQQLEALNQLMLFIYGEALPEPSHRSESNYAEVLTQLTFNDRPRLPPGFKEAATAHIETLTEALAKESSRQINLGSELAEHLAKEDVPILPLINRVNGWLTWVGKEWLTSTEQKNPCRFFGEDIDNDLRLLRQEFDYPAGLNGVANRFSTSACYEPTMRKLAAMQLPPYGNLFEKRNGILIIASGIGTEMRGLAQLATQDFMQLRPRQQFTCLSAAVGWRPQSLSEADRYIRDYQSFARLSGADAAQSSSGSRPLYDQLARKHLQAVLDDILSQGQMPLPQVSALQRDSSEGLSNSDQELAQRGSDFAKVVDPLLSTLRLYRQLGFVSPANRITQCARNFSSDMLLKAEALAQASRLYEPATDKPKEGAGDTVYAIGGAAIVKDYLARQLQRGQVLAGYAAPFVAFLKNSEAVDEARQTNIQSASYWDNTLSEVRRYVQFKEPNGQVAHLENLFLKQLADLTFDNCGKTLAGYQSESLGNDFFSARRRVLENDARWRCNNRREADAYAQYRNLATRFNRDLAGRFPFAPASERDASPQLVKAFFADYDAQRDSLRAATANLSDPRWQGLRHFLDQLDKSAAFFRSNLTAAEAPQPLRADIVFHAHAKQSPGSEQIVAWRLTSGSRVASYPNGANSLDWQAGEMLLLELQWAEQSKFRPVADPLQPEMSVEGNVAAFANLGDWALLRFIANHRPKATVLNLDANQAIVEINVPVSSQKVGPAPGAMSNARVYLGITLNGGNPANAPAAAGAAAPVKTAGSTPLKLPAFPQKAPLIW